jgi:uncharacterized Fe-S cluster protein YjdI
MSERNIIKKYTNGEITVVWEPKKCIHAGVCVKMLPGVYNPEIKPWINIDNGTTKELKAQVSECPSGALSYFMNDGEDREAGNLETVVEVMQNGPLLVYGTLKITNSNGEKEIKNKTTAFCRCGASNNKPYCDGAHKKIEFEG